MVVLRKVEVLEGELKRIAKNSKSKHTPACTQTHRGRNFTKTRIEQCLDVCGIQGEVET
jgi:hypothetical protein